MEEALEILWTYARREPLDNNGETIVPTVNNSIAAIRIIMRLEGWGMGSEKIKMNSEKRATPAYATSDKPAHRCMGKVSKSEKGVVKSRQRIISQHAVVGANGNSPNHKMPNRNSSNPNMFNTTRIITIPNSPNVT